MKLPTSSRDVITSKSGNRGPQNVPHASDTSSAGSPPAIGRRAVPGYDLANEISDLSITSVGRSK